MEYTELLCNGESLIRAFRTHINLTQEELACLLSVRQDTISRWERSSWIPENMGMREILIFCEFFGIGPTELLTKYISRDGKLVKLL